MVQSKKLLLITLAAMLTFSFAFAATANAKMVKKVDNFIIFLDQSGSMAMKNADGMKKIEKAVDDIQALNKVIPALNYNSAMYLFAPFAEQCGPKPYNATTLNAAAAAVNENYEIFNRKTPMGVGLAAINPVLGQMSGKTALIIFTDGESNIGSDPVAVAQDMRGKYGDKLCVHVVSYASSPAGQTVIDGIRAAFPCSVAADGATFANAAALQQYAKDVLYDEVADAPAPAPAPAPAVMAPAKEVVSFNLNFGFDKYAITDEMVPVLEQAKMILEEDASASYEISGYTDSTGAEEYNQGLSERRANSVMKWMTTNGIAASRLEAVGYGETNPKYDNGTSEGRKLNRRVDIQTK
ncbi:MULTISPECIES: OmpA family protein [unclassified Pseudodesulfovibrio]|uniref:OmpA family protein n=1 Tax=unclassified Pseudodesulfovibrio TaxID=2661612 RepID=UPI000FEBD191|nr:MULTISPECIES: OmpA family protein [unclassified Pseudodesulfovibrio]MCJ2165355.1 OmpA family protein [Pseudodesulfovibrio sp. S3-i]RWU02817.1 flagellar motor protein MotB [Pseudodesulfovibrio sp. S3]